jgi:hypothetical protein
LLWTLTETINNHLESGPNPENWLTSAICSFLLNEPPSPMININKTNKKQTTVNVSIIKISENATCS